MHNSIEISLLNDACLINYLDFADTPWRRAQS